MMHVQTCICLRHSEQRMLTGASNLIGRRHILQAHVKHISSVHELPLTCLSAVCCLFINVLG